MSGRLKTCSINSRAVQGQHVTSNKHNLQDGSISTFIVPVAFIPFLNFYHIPKTVFNVLWLLRLPLLYSSMEEHYVTVTHSYKRTEFTVSTCEWHSILSLKQRHDFCWWMINDFTVICDNMYDTVKWLQCKCSQIMRLCLFDVYKERRWSQDHAQSTGFTLTVGLNAINASSNWNISLIDTITTQYIQTFPYIYNHVFNIVQTK